MKHKNELDMKSKVKKSISKIKVEFNVFIVFTVKTWNSEENEIKKNKGILILIENKINLA